MKIIHFKRILLVLNSSDTLNEFENTCKTTEKLSEKSYTLVINIYSNKEIIL